MIRILVTGSRELHDYHLVRIAIADAVIEYGRDAVIVHGAASRGADAFADDIATNWGLEVERHPADWENEGKAAGVLRNQRMVDLGATVCLAFPVGEARGTRDCIRRAHKAGILVKEYT